MDKLAYPVPACFCGYCTMYGMYNFTKKSTTQTNQLPDQTCNPVTELWSHSPMKELRVLSRRSKTCLQLCVSFTWFLGRQSYLVRVLTPTSNIVLERQLRKITSRKLDPCTYKYKRKMYYGFKRRVWTTPTESHLLQIGKNIPQQTSYFFLNLNFSITTQDTKKLLLFSEN